MSTPSLSPRPDALALFSGGLDSILAARLIQDQGLSVLCLHFVTPFFGKPQNLEHWENVYGLRIQAIDISDEFIHMLRQRPAHGYGKVMNPCVDCKILMMRHARTWLERLGARCLVSGEVLGQRPMSQRRDTLNVIRRDGNVRELLLRPLCAQHLDPTQVEIDGLVDRSRLLGICGRGRKDQLALAAAMQITEIPAPAGGCRLAEKENARAYWPVLRRLPEPATVDFRLANIGRQFWDGPHWLIVGRNQADNEALEALAGPDDLRIKVLDMPGPLALARHAAPVGAIPWSDDDLRHAAALAASYAPRAQSLATVDVRLSSNDGQSRVLTVTACRSTPLRELRFDDLRQEIRNVSLGRDVPAEAEGAPTATDDVPAVAATLSAQTDDVPATASAAVTADGEETSE